MREQDYDEFAGLLADVWSLKGQALTAGQKAMFFRALAAHPIEEVRAGLDAHVRDPRRGQFLPMPADVIGQIQGIVADDGRPGPEEAWAKAMRAADENASLVWTDEMAQAWGIAAPIMSNGDDIGARMAFKEAYTRLVDEARRARRPVNWTATLGHDKGGHAEALIAGHAAGLLPAPDVLALPAPVSTIDELVRRAPDAVRDRLAAIKADLVARKAEPVSTPVRKVPLMPPHALPPGMQDEAA